MDPVEEQHLQQPDEARPAKRVRLEAPLDVSDHPRDETMNEDDDDWDDVYGSNSPRKPDAAANDPAAPPQAPLREAPPPTFAPPEASTIKAEAQSPQKKPAQQPLEGVPAEAISEGDAVVAPSTRPALGAQEEHVLDETTQAERGPSVSHADADGEQSVPGAETAESDTHGIKIMESALVQQSDSVDVPMIDTDGLMSNPKVSEDAEFMAAAAAQRGQKDSEWQYGSSDAESSSDSDTSSDDSSDESDSGSDGGYEMLDPATAAKILMAGEGDDDDGGRGKGKPGAEHQPRTANEVKEEVVPKPDVTVTPDMKITLLGTVERTLEHMALIKGATPGEYQVLESGSVLCNEKREVIGAVAETFGRVQEPLYSVAFTNAAELEELGVKYGAQIFYVDTHSIFVFTQPLKNLKGTDASNIHDEEVGEDELEFSDDEKEAEFKRQKKLAKKAGKGILSRGDFNQGVSYGTPAYEQDRTYVRGGDAPTQTYGGGMSYDDDDQPAAPDEFYAPLKRPDNLSELMAGGAPPPKPPTTFDRGRGRGRGDRGRGDRGRGDRGRGRGDRGRGRGGGFEQRNQRGGRGGSAGHQQQYHSQRGNARDFSDRQGSHSDTDHQQAQHASSQAAQVPPSTHQQYQAHSQYQQESPQTYQFNGYTFQYGPPQPQASSQEQQQAQYNAYYAQQQAQLSMPSGTYVNPAYYPQQQQQQLQQAYPSWSAQQQHYAHSPSSAAPSGSAGQQQPQVPDLGEILKRIGGPHAG